MLRANRPIGRGQCCILSRFKNRDHSSMLPRLGKVMVAENRVEDMGEERKVWLVRSGRGIYTGDEVY